MAVRYFFSEIRELQVYLPEMGIDNLSRVTVGNHRISERVDISLWDKMEIVLADNLNYGRWLGFIPLKGLIDVGNLSILFRQTGNLGVSWAPEFTTDSRNMCLTI